MRVELIAAVALAAALVPAPAAAQAAVDPVAFALPQDAEPGGAGGGDARKLRSCFSRPTLVDSACLVDPGHVFVESAFVDWTRDDTASKREDQTLTGVLTVRFGLTEHTELTIDWGAAYGHDYDRNKKTGAIETTVGVGDVRILIRQNIINPDGPSKGFSLGVLPYVYVPTGRTPIGDGDWSYGVIVPFGFPLSDKANLSFSPQVQAAVDDDGHGRQVNFGGVGAFEYDLAKPLTVALELSERRDNDPSGHTTESLAAAELLVKPRDGLQLDIGAVAGLNADSPDLRLLTGIAARF